MRLRIRRPHWDDWIYLTFSAHEEDQILDQDALAVMDDVAARMIDPEARVSESDGDWIVESQFAWGEWKEIE